MRSAAKSIVAGASTTIPIIEPPIAWLTAERDTWRDRVKRYELELQQLQADLDSAVLNLACCDRLLELAEVEGSEDA